LDCTLFSFLLHWTIHFVNYMVECTIIIYLILLMPMYIRMALVGVLYFLTIVSWVSSHDLKCFCSPY
jgi:hypothetical protein